MDPDLYMLMVFIIMEIAILVPILVRILYDPKTKYAGYCKRNIFNSNLNSELAIVACILLDVSSPTRDSPISVNVLHLVKLSAQTSPIFITHQLEKHAPSKHYSYSVIFSFEKFEYKHNGGVALNVSTTITPDDMMDEDICTLALDKHASFIILPFHRRWYINGSIESDDHTIMALNWSVFERAPCSVGVLVDRGHNDSPILLVHHREALTFAKRMAQDTKVKLTMLYIHTAMDNEIVNSTHWEHMLDSEVSKDVQNNVNVKYVKEEGNDGHITTLMLREMVNDYQLMIVGRRFGVDCLQTSGLKEWSEFSELGILGDFLAVTTPNRDRRLNPSYPES